MRLFPRAALCVLLLVLPASPDVSNCACDPSRPETMKERNCSLCNEAEKQSSGAEFFVLKDINPRKPGRWLVLPKEHYDGTHDLHDMPPETRARFWKFAIAVAREKFGDDWGLAYNGNKVRTQCHLHIHVGRWVPAAENSKFVVVRRVEEFPVPTTGGVFIHPAPGGYHAHTGEEIMETALVR
jgi:diadenosine tetraphosphate (Ap4A) HIT family hydrolase